MATLRPRPDSGPPASVKRIPLSALLEGDVAWRGHRDYSALREAIADVLTGHPAYDPRRVLPLEGSARATWLGDQRAYLAAHFTGDARIDVHR